MFIINDTSCKNPLIMFGNYLRNRIKLLLLIYRKHQLQRHQLNFSQFSLFFDNYYFCRRRRKKGSERDDKDKIADMN